MISVKKNRWTALSKALGPFLYGFSSFPWASYSRGRDGAWLARSLIPLLREDERDACSAWEQVEFDIRRRETRVELENEWRAAKAIPGCKPTTRLNLEYMVSIDSEQWSSLRTTQNGSSRGLSKPIKFMENQRLELNRDVFNDCKSKGKDKGTSLVRSGYVSRPYLWIFTLN